MGDDIALTWVWIVVRYNRESQKSRNIQVYTEEPKARELVKDLESNEIDPDTVYYVEQMVLLC